MFYLSPHPRPDAPAADQAAPEPHAETQTPPPAAADPATLAPDITREVQAAFVQVLSQWGNVRAAATQVGVSRAHLYRMRRASPEFRRLWDAALLVARPQVEEVLADRALNGTAETVFYHGEEVATRTRYDARLLLAHLARLDRIESNFEVRKVAAEFDTGVARLLDPPVPATWDEAEDEDDAFDEIEHCPNCGCDEDDWDEEEDEGEGEDEGED